MQATHFERLGGGAIGPHRRFNPVVIRCTYVGNCTRIGTRNQATSARRGQQVIDRVFRFAEANEAYC